MREFKKTHAPVKPVDLELFFVYQCPFCGCLVSLAGSTHSTLAQCDVCKDQFSIVPADDRSIQFIKIMLANGKAGIDPNFL
ncbi:conserved hypothetical protein [Desulfovibrionales bacterium]